jgi:energy-coupling factor transport system substrate-specific component
MSWQLASFLIVGAVLVGGFAWYERSRPPSQVVALVAALAALAIAGRIAFAAFPNVKPTTDIVVFAGYALGPAPGFAVGAFAGLVSNFWFGQGPWTPWQMAGWGMCGLLGAALSLGARNASRLTLAAVCGFAGIAYGLLLNFSLMATYGGDLTLQRFLALEARAIPFDAAHAIGNVAFALLAGPAMVRMLSRFRRRFEWRTPAVATALVAAFLLPAMVPGQARADAAGAAGWLEKQQNDDGGFGASPGDPSSAAITGWAMLGLEAAGRNPYDVALGGSTPLDFLRGHLDEVGTPGDLARTIVALQGAGADPRSFAGQDLVAKLIARRAVNGSFAGWPGTTAFSVIALRTAGAGVAGTLSWLAGVQNDDGGWGDVPGQPSNVDVTGAAMQAMPDAAAAEAGLSYLRQHQHSNGGFALGNTGDVNSQSTAWAAQGMIAVGADPARIASHGHTALDYLAARQAADGHYRYSASSDQTPVWVTGEVLVAAAGNALPIPPPPRTKQPAPHTSHSQPLPSSPETGSSSTPPVPYTTPPSPGSPTPGSPDAVVPPVGGGGGAGAPTAPLLPGNGAELPPATTVPSPDQETGGPAPVTASGDAPSPWAPLGIGAAVTAMAIGAPWWLGRRLGW